jgi:hypothetical protein
VTQPATLAVMRLADMHKVHPQQDNTRVCSGCGETVGIYPSGQRALRDTPGLRIVCNVCAWNLPPATVSKPAPGALEEIGQSVPKGRA